jgi:thermitase
VVKNENHYLKSHGNETFLAKKKVRRAMKKRNRRSLITALMLTASMLMSAVAPVAAQVETESGTELVDPADIIPGEVIIKYKEGYSTYDLQRQSKMAIRSLNVVEESSTEEGLVLHKLQPGEDIEEVIEQLEKSPIVEYAEPNIKYYTSAAQVNDTYYSQQWGAKDVNVEAGWQILNGVTGSVTVAVVDTGVDADHPDLAGRILQGKNFAIKMGNGENYPENRDADDDEGHGTLVSGVIAASSITVWVLLELQVRLISKSCQ